MSSLVSVHLPLLPRWYNSTIVSNSSSGGIPPVGPEFVLISSSPANAKFSEYAGRGELFSMRSGRERALAHTKTAPTTMSRDFMRPPGVVGARCHQTVTHAVHLQLPPECAATYRP